MQLASFNKALLRVERVFCYVAAGLVFVMIFPTTIDVFLGTSWRSPCRLFFSSPSS